MSSRVIGALVEMSLVPSLSVGMVTALFVNSQHGFSWPWLAVGVASLLTQSFVSVCGSLQHFQRFGYSAVSPRYVYAATLGAFAVAVLEPAQFTRTEQTALLFSALNLAIWLAFDLVSLKLPRPGAPVPRVGDPLPPFAASTLSGDVVSDRAVRPGVLVVVRGVWSTLCRAYVREMADAARSHGVQMLVVVPQTTDPASDFADRTPDEVSVVVDTDGQIIAGLGLTHPHGVPLLAPTNDAHTAIPATFAVDSAGVIRLAIVSRDLRVRPKPAVAIGAALPA